MIDFPALKHVSTMYGWAKHQVLISFPETFSPESAPILYANR